MIVNGERVGLELKEGAIENVSKSLALNDVRDNRLATQVVMSLEKKRWNDTSPRLKDIWPVLNQGEGIRASIRRRDLGD
jgi:hypothetical protein